MNCSDAARVLNAVQLGRDDSLEPAIKPADQYLLDDLATLGHLDRRAAAAPVDGKLVALKKDLESLRTDFEDGRVAEATYRSREGELRTQILELAELEAVAGAGVQVAGRRYALTFRGRTLLGAISARLGRVDALPLADFEAQMEGLRQSLEERAKRATEIYRILRASLSSMNPVTLRNAAVGLAVRGEPPDEIAGAYQSALSDLVRGAAWPSGRVSLLAEVLVVGAPDLSIPGIAAQAGELQRLYERVLDYFPETRAYGSNREDAGEAAAMLLALDPDKRDAALQGALSFRQAIGSAGGPYPESIAAWILLGCTGLAFQEGAGDWVMQMREELLRRRCPTAEAEMATAILGASRGEAGTELLFQFDTARSYLGRLSEDSFVVPAAMLAAVPTSITETMDDLRMASAAATAGGLAEGGTETLSLGVKLLIQTSLIAVDSTRRYSVGPSRPEALAPLRLEGLALILPTALVALYAFHEVTLNQAAESAYAFHPVHTHYIYG